MKKLLPVLCFLFLLACDKDDDDAPCTTNAASIAGSYKIIATTYLETPTSDIEDIYTTYDECEKDDVITFKTDNTYNFLDKGALCTPQRNENGTWSYTGSSMTLNGGAITLVSFNCKTMVLERTDVDVDGDKFTITLQRQ
jgi:hypothetical protein